MSDSTQSETRDLLMQCVMSSADLAFLDATGTTSDRVNAAVGAAFDMAIGNRLITVNEPAGWPKYLAMSAPYDLNLTGGKQP